MSSKAQQLIKFFLKRGGVARFSIILKEGFHPDTLVTLEREGKIEKMNRGLYRLAHSITGPHPDLVAACLQAPGGVICLISSLAFHEATNEIPGAVDLAIERGSHANKIQYPPVKFYQFAPEAWEAGIGEHKVEGHTIRVYHLAKTVADCFKFRNQIGMDVARSALKSAVTEKRVSPKEIMRYAKICRVSNIIKPILESLI